MVGGSGVGAGVAAATDVAAMVGVAVATDVAAMAGVAVGVGAASSSEPDEHPAATSNVPAAVNAASIVSKPLDGCREFV